MLVDRRSSPTSRTSALSPWWTVVLYWAIAAVPVVVVLAVPQLVLEDGGLHLSNATALRGLIHGWWPDLLTWRAALNPNTTGELSLLGLTSFLGPDAALRIATIMGMLGYAGAVAMLVRALKLPLFTGLLLLPLEMSFPTMMGFLGFTWAVPLALVSIAVAVRQPTKRRLFPLVVLLTLTWLTHIVPALVAVFVITIVVLFSHRSAGSSWGRAALLTFKAVAPPAAPAVVLSAFWLVGSGTATLSDGPGVGAALKGMLEFSAPLVSLAHVEYWCARMLAVTCVAAAVCALVYRMRWRWVRLPEDGFVAAGLVLAYPAIMLPENSASGAGFIATRLSLFAVILLTLWLATQWPTRSRLAMAPAGAGRHAANPSTNGHAPHPQSTPAGGVRVVHVATWWASLLVAGIVAVAVPLARVAPLRQLAAELDEIRSLAPCLPMRSTFVQLNLDDGGDQSARGMSPMAEQTGHLAVEREALDLGNESGWYPFYLWRYRDNARADRQLALTGSIDAVPPDLHLSEATAAGLRLDAVVIYGRTTSSDATRTSPNAQRLNDDLARSFRQVAMSPGGNAELWLRREEPPVC
jgi:hypothetical protein